MVARNLERGLGFLRPQLDTAPFPNDFLVEPPVYQAATVGLRRATGCRLEAAGRIISALAMGLAAWGLFGLIRRRDGEAVALAAVAAFSLLPVTLRYGRAFQPDALMLGGVLAGANCWDLARDRVGRWKNWMIAGWLLLALGLACKVIAAFVLIPIGLAVLRPRRLANLLLLGTTLLPAISWYLWTYYLVESETGSKASADNHAIWLAALGFSGLARRETLLYIWRFLLIRAFTPLGLILAVWGLFRRGSRDPVVLDIWRVWGLSALLTMALLAEKLHHEYYWLCLAPVVAAGLGRALVGLAGIHRVLALAAALAFLVMSAYLTRSTWQTPSEWNEIETAGRRIQVVVPADDWLVAPEPLLFQADRRGCRLEFTARAAGRAAAEWMDVGPATIHGPLDLIEFYRLRGARYVADVGPRPGDDRRIALHEAIRRRYKVLVDRASVLIAELNPSEYPGHVQ
jgi:4-amino-4-deoxy-L-arabinose transferase-like glycosyltransferase